MTSPPPLRILLCNDDGIDGVGLAHLAEAARHLSDDIWTVAPRDNQSARGRAFTAGATVYAERRDERAFAVDGTPVDCVILALNGLIPGPCPDLLLSGVNEGANLAEEIETSGTVGACMEADDQGVPAIAFSQFGAYRNTTAAAWATTRDHLPRLLPELIAALGIETGVLNVNFPPGPVQGLRVVPAGQRAGPVRIEPRGPSEDGRIGYYVDQLRPDAAQSRMSDIGMLLEGYVTVTPLDNDPSNRAALSTLRALLENEGGGRR